MTFSVFPAPASFPRGNFIWWLQIFSSILCLPEQARGMERGPALSSLDAGLLIFLSICTAKVSVFSQFQSTLSFPSFCKRIRFRQCGRGTFTVLGPVCLRAPFTVTGHDLEARVVYCVFIGTPKYLLFSLSIQPPAATLEGSSVGQPWSHLPRPHGYFGYLK